ncbi:MAG TPA: DDE-type integrase/transposase/recombinase, partial [Candidatus Limnocylindrales bacterium]
MTGAPVRYVACHPGALVHQDHKKLGRVPDGGGWRVLGRGHASQDRRVRGYDHLEVFVDDASRYGVVVPVADERGESASWAVEIAVARFAEVGIRIERMLTDNGASHRSHAYRDVLERFEIGHKRPIPWGSETRIRSCGEAVVLVDESAEQVPAANVARADLDRLCGRCERW